MGKYDVPAFIDQILQSTGKKSIDGYIGHGMGSTQFFAANALIPKYFEERVKMHFSLGGFTRLDYAAEDIFYRCWLWIDAFFRGGE